MTWRRAATIVAGKELREAVRDRRSLGSALVYAIWGPLVMALALTALARDHGTDRSGRRSRSQSVDPVVGRRSWLTPPQRPLQHPVTRRADGRSGRGPIRARGRRRPNPEE